MPARDGGRGVIGGCFELAFREPESGVVVYVAGNSCGIFGVLAGILAALYPDIPLQ